MNFSEWLNREIESRGIRLKWLYERAGISRATLNNAKSGNKGVETDTIIKIANALGADPIYCLQLAGKIEYDKKYKRFLSNYTLYKICSHLSSLEDDQVESVSRIILPAIEACKEKGGDISSTPEETKPGHG